MTPDLGCNPRPRKSSAIMEFWVYPAGGGIGGGRRGGAAGGPEGIGAYVGLPNFLIVAARRAA
jgi:hypothetical protein